MIRGNVKAIVILPYLSSKAAHWMLMAGLEGRWVPQALLNTSDAAS